MSYIVNVCVSLWLYRLYSVVPCSIYLYDCMCLHTHTYKRPSSVFNCFHINVGFDAQSDSFTIIHFRH